MKSYLILQKIIKNSTDLLLEMDDEEFNSKPHPDKWSKKEIIGHLIDSAYNNHSRIVRGTYEEELIFLGYDQNQWVLLNRYQNRSAHEVIKTWQTCNYHFSLLIKGMPANILHRETHQHNFETLCMTTVHAGTSSSLAYLFWDYLYHLEHHLCQIFSDYQRINDPQFKKEIN